MMAPRGRGRGGGRQGGGGAHRRRDGSCGKRSARGTMPGQRSSAGVEIASAVALPLLKIAGRALLTGLQRLLQSAADQKRQLPEGKTDHRTLSKPPVQQVRVLKVEDVQGEPGQRSAQEEHAEKRLVSGRSAEETGAGSLTESNPEREENNK